MRAQRLDFGGQQGVSSGAEKLYVLLHLGFIFGSRDNVPSRAVLLVMPISRHLFPHDFWRPANILSIYPTVLHNTQKRGTMHQIAKKSLLTSGPLFRCATNQLSLLLRRDPARRGVLGETEPRVAAQRVDVDELHHAAVSFEVLAHPATALS